MQRCFPLKAFQGCFFIHKEDTSQSFKLHPNDTSSTALVIQRKEHGSNVKG